MSLLTSLNERKIIQDMQSNQKRL